MTTPDAYAGNGMRNLHSSYLVATLGERNKKHVLHAPQYGVLNGSGSSLLCREASSANERCRPAQHRHETETGEAGRRERTLLSRCGVWKVEWDA